MAEVAFAQHDAGKKRPQRKRHAEQHSRTIGNAKRGCEHRQREQLARAGTRDVRQKPRDRPRANDQHQRQKQPKLAQRQRQDHPERIAGGGAGSTTEPARQCRQQHQRQHHRQVFNDQPADGDAPVRRVEHTVLLQRAQQYHRAGDGQRQAEHQAGTEGPAPQMRHADTQRRGYRDLPDRTGNGHPADGQQILDREMQPDPEHQQDDADFCKLGSELCVGNEPWRKRPDRDAGQQIADQRRQLDLAGKKSTDKREQQPHDDGGDECGFVRHRSPAAMLGARSGDRVRSRSLQHRIFTGTHGPLRQHGGSTLTTVQAAIGTNAHSHPPRRQQAGLSGGTRPPAPAGRPPPRCAPSACRRPGSATRSRRPGQAPAARCPPERGWRSSPRWRPHPSGRPA
ncbi:MAG: hypothetical protein OZX49_02024 [Immundisolibacter sp.]|nr:hypothetical protein [Immundisolibacter sp.]